MAMRYSFNGCCCHLHPTPIWCSKSAVIFCLCVFVLISSLKPCVAQTQQPLTLLVDDQLQYQIVGLESITESAVGFFDHNWSYQQLPRKRVLQLRHIETREVIPIMPSQRLAMLTLTDGQQFVGRMQIPTTTEDQSTQVTDASVIQWYSPILGALSISLDRVKSLILEPTDTATTLATDDRVQLTNGDQLQGFVLGLTPNALELELGEQKTVAKLPLDQVSAIRLANPVVVPKKPRHRLYLVDGTVLLCNDVLLSRQQAIVMDTDWQKRTRLPMREITRIDLASTHQQILSLSSRPHTLVGGAQAFGVDFPPTINDQTIAMQAPTSLRFELPAHTTRFAADAMIHWQHNAPPRARKWTDFTLYVRVDDKQLIELPFNAKTPEHRINLPIIPGSKQLSLQITPGLNGPVMDRLKLSEPLLLIEP